MSHTGHFDEIAIIHRTKEAYISTCMLILLWSRYSILHKQIITSLYQNENNTFVTYFIKALKIFCTKKAVDHNK